MLIHVAAAIGLCAYMALAGAARAQAEPAAGAPLVAQEYQVKAAFLYHFAKLTQWPVGSFAGPSPRLQVCLLGADPFGAALDSLAGKIVQNHPLSIMRIAAPTDAGPCHLLFISQSEQARVSEVLAAVAAQPVLTISDITGFTNAGGMIDLKIVDKRINFSVNLPAARRANLDFGSKLLALAEIVHD